MSSTSRRLLVAILVASGLFACTERGLLLSTPSAPPDMASSPRIDASVPVDASVTVDASVPIDASMSVDLLPPVTPCEDPLGCYPASSSNASYYSGPNCDGVEYATRIQDGEIFHSTWDGRGLIGNTAVMVSPGSWKDTVGRCHGALALFTGYRVYRPAADLTCSCGPCSTCIDGQCVEIVAVRGAECAPQTCDADGLRTYACAEGACAATLAFCPTQCWFNGAYRCKPCDCPPTTCTDTQTSTSYSCDSTNGTCQPHPSSCGSSGCDQSTGECTGTGT